MKVRVCSFYAKSYANFLDIGLGPAIKKDEIVRVIEVTGGIIAPEYLYRIEGRRDLYPSTPFRRLSPLELLAMEAED